MARLGEGLRTIGALPNGVSALGDYAEHAVAGVLGAPGGTVIGRAAQAAAKTAVRGIVEGGLFGAGSGISEAALEDKPLVGEKLFTSIGHGALMGGVLGAGISATGSSVRDMLGSLIEKQGGKLADAAGEQAWKWLDPLKRYSMEANARAGGTAAVGRTVFDQVLRPLIEERGLSAASMTADEKLALVQAAADRTGKQIGELVSGAEGTAIPLSEMLKPIDARIREFRGKVGGEDKVAAMERLRDSVLDVLEPGAEARAQAAVPQDYALSLRDQGLGLPRPERAIEMQGQAGIYGHAPSPIPHAEPIVMGEGGPTLHPFAESLSMLPDEAGAPIGIADHSRPTIAAGAEADLQGAPTARRAIGIRAVPKDQAALEAARTVPIAQAIEQRRALQQIAYQESKALDPKLRVELLRDVTRAWGELEIGALNEASKGDGLMGDRLRALNKQFQQLTIAENALESNTARHASNNMFSLGDKMFGAAHLAGALASGHPLAAAGAIGTSLAHKALREHGNAYAALLLDRLGTWGGVSRAVADVDEQVDRAVEGALARQPAPIRGRPRVFQVRADDSEERFDREHARVTELAALSPAVLQQHAQDRAAPIATHAPEVAGAMAQTTVRATQYLASKLPPTPLPPPLQPGAPPRYAADQRASFLRSVDAVEGGPPAIMARLAKGTVTPEDIDAMREVYPAQYAELRVKLAHAAANRKSPTSYEQRLRISKFLGQPMDATLSPDFARSVQVAYAAAPQERPRAGTGASSSSARASISKSMMGPFEAAQGR